MKKITMIAVSFILLCSAAVTAQVTTTRSLTWKWTNSLTWPTVWPSNNWDNKMNWYLTGTTNNPSTNVTNGDKLIIPNTSGLKITVSTMTIAYNNLIIQVNGSAQFIIASNQTLTMSGAATVFDMVTPSSGNGLLLNSGNGGGGNKTRLIMNGMVKAYNSNNSVLIPPAGVSRHAVSTDPTFTSTDGYGGFFFGALPVKLGTFSASITGGSSVSVNWNTLQEINTDHFTVEKSSDGIHWNSLANLKAAGNTSVSTSYHLTDENPVKGSNYYRIITVDLDGKASISAVRSIQFNSFGKITLYPNPAVNQVTVTLPQAPADWSITLLNHSGQLLLQNHYSKGTTTVSVPVSAFPAGDYFIRIYDGSQPHDSKLIISR